MKVTNTNNVEVQKVDMEGAAGCTVRWLVGEKDGAPTFAMRQFEVEPGGYTPRHHHPRTIMSLCAKRTRERNHHHHHPHTAYPSRQERRPPG